MPIPFLVLKSDIIGIKPYVVPYQLQKYLIKGGGGGGRRGKRRGRFLRFTVWVGLKLEDKLQGSQGVCG